MSPLSFFDSLYTLRDVIPIDSSAGPLYSALDRARFFGIRFKYGSRLRSVQTVFVHVPRCAGMHVSNLLYGGPVGHMYGDYLRSKVFGERLFDSLQSLAIVRCPVNRLISAYAFSVTRGTNVVSQSLMYRPPRAMLYSFQRFCYDWLFHRRFVDIDYVFRPQSWWICSPSGEKIVNTLIDIGSVDKLCENLGYAHLSHAPRANSSSAQIFRSAKGELTGDLIADILKFYDCDVTCLGATYVSEYM
jgi:hypothetical protein